MHADDDMYKFQNKTFYIILIFQFLDFIISYIILSKSKNTTTTIMVLIFWGFFSDLIALDNHFSQFE